MIKYTYLILIFICVSCVKEFDLENSKNNSILTVEGVISNDTSISYIRLSYCSTRLHQQGSAFNENYTFINDAIVIVSDDAGNIDTLKPAPEFIYYSDSNYTTNEKYQKGYYFLTSVKPQPLHTYYLTILNQGKQYHSQCYMPALPQIDSVSFSYNQGETGKSDYYIPHIYFQDNPNEQNYYLFSTGESYGFVWLTSILNDDLINGTYVNGLDIFHGQSNISWRNGYLSSDMPYWIEIHSLTKEAYLYYDALIREFKNDGGTYKPSPASPVSNIDNGALGFFRASTVVIFKGDIH